MTKVIILCALMVFAAFGPCYSAEEAEGQEVSTMSGKLVAMDWVNSTIVVKIKLPGGLADEMTYHISRSTKITKGTSTLSFGELHEQDRVTIEYFNQRFQGLHAIHVTVAS
jgi:hypothetical protein